MCSSKSRGTASSSILLWVMREFVVPGRSGAAQLREKEREGQKREKKQVKRKTEVIVMVMIFINPIPSDPSSHRIPYLRLEKSKTHTHVIF